MLIFFLFIKIVFYIQFFVFKIRIFSSEITFYFFYFCGCKYYEIKFKCFLVLKMKNKEKLMNNEKY